MTGSGESLGRPEPWPAPAKLNLFLHIVGRSADGYHLLQTLFRLIDLQDELRFWRRPPGTIERIGDVPGVPAEADLTLEAARRLNERAGGRHGVAIELRKRIPVQSGLGGGSSDAATVLAALDLLWGLELGPEALAGIGLELGADVPFFLLGRNAEAHPTLARRELAEGHSIGHHTYNHPLLDHMSLDKADAEVNRGIAADEFAVYGERRTQPATPFFRFPGFASNQALLDRMNDRGLVVFGADVWASDWLPMTPEQQLALIIGRVEKAGRGIVLFHDTKTQTARMLPAFLRELKRRGFKIVHVAVPEHRRLFN